MPLFVIPYPIIDPVAIEIGPLAVRWYGLAYMAGILLGWLYGRYLVSRPDLWNGKPPMTISQADDFLLWITLGIVVGGRLGFVLFYEPSYFWANPAEIPAVWNGGMSFHGGLLGVVARRLSVRPRQAASIRCRSATSPRRRPRSDCSSAASPISSIRRWSGG